jgi:alkaline phosphatase
MDTLDVTGLVMTPSLNALITDSSPGMSAHATGQKANNNQEGVFPTTPRTPSTTRASNMSASCCGARVVRDSTSAS